MTSIQRRFNSTGRLRITRNRVEVSLEERADPNVIPTAHATMKLDGLDLPGDATVAIEAYYRTSSMRFPCGTVNSVSIPERMVLSEIDKGGAVRFRVLVIASDGSGRILAAADGLRPSAPEDGAGREALLPMRETDIGNELWKIEVDYRTGPILLVNNRITGLAAQIRMTPLLQGLILPHAFRAILQSLGATDQSDEDNVWGDSWRRFLTELGVATEPDDPEDTDSQEEWIEAAVRAFADRKEFAAMVKLVALPEISDA